MPSPSQVCSFALMLPVYHYFDYLVDTEISCEPGQRFMLPFGSSEKPGLLVSCRSEVDGTRKLKPVGEALDQEALLSSHLMELAAWMADYYCQPAGELLFQFLPRYLRRKQQLHPVTVEYWCAQHPSEEILNNLQRKAPRQLQLLELLLENEAGLHAAALNDQYGSWRAAMKGLQSKGLVTTQMRDPLYAQHIDYDTAPSLTDEQQQAVNAISAGLGSFRVDLLQGVTGSGKTEVYLAIMQQVIAQGKQVIYLVPEIGLTPQLLQRLLNRLGREVVSSHSGQSEYTRYQSWEQFRRGVARVVIGTRSALFSEAPDLGLIIIDEEHDSSYRQQDGVRYHARDVAIKRAQMLGISVLLGSATPALETLYNLSRPHYYHHLLRQRPAAATPPQIQLIDSARVNLTSGCSPQLLQAMRQHLQQGGQVLLFLNRRGFAPVIMCHECGWQALCHQCDARMTLHQSINRMVCHHCGYAEPVVKSCPDCGEKEIRHYGIGTEQLQQFIQQAFADIPVIRIDRDSISNARQMEQMLQPVREAEPCILIGTQMLAKGHDYPDITLVGILDSDQALYSSFYRATERLIQTVLQVSGRAGRASKRGQALLQTAFPEHELMQALCHQDYSELVQPIMQERQMIGFPPYVRVITLSADALELNLAMNRLQQIHRVLMALDQASAIKVVGPIPALMTRRIGRYRAQLSLLGGDIRLLRQVLHQLLPEIQRVKNSQRLRLVIEVDPLDL